MNVTAKYIITIILSDEEITALLEERDNILDQDKCATLITDIAIACHRE